MSMSKKDFIALGIVNANKVRFGETDAERGCSIVIEGRQ